MFKSLNISNLDVSFNGSATKKRDELNQSKASLIKSFALQGKERSIKAWKEEKATENQPAKAKQNVQVTTLPQIQQSLASLVFSPLPSLPAFHLLVFLATHFRTDWLSWLGLGNQVGSTTDHLTN